MTKHAGETGSDQWSWVERTVWTDRMLEALEEGVKGGVWFSLIDKVHRPKVLFAAWQQVRGKGRAVGSDHQSLKQFEERLETNLAKLEAELHNRDVSATTDPSQLHHEAWQQGQAPVGHTGGQRQSGPNSAQNGHRTDFRV